MRRRGRLSLRRLVGHGGEGGTWLLLLLVLLILPYKILCLRNCLHYYPVPELYMYVIATRSGSVQVVSARSTATRGADCWWRVLVAGIRVPIG